MSLYHRLITTTALPWRMRKNIENWIETDCREAHPAFYRWLHFGAARERASPVTFGPKHHFFGYYDKTPWNADGTLLLTHEADFNERPPTANDKVIIGVVRLEDSRFEPLGSAHCWNWQQGAMLQWHPGAPNNQFFHNDRRDGRFVGVLRDTTGKELRIYERPLYAIDPKGKFGFSVNFARLQTHRPGYGYAGLADPYADHSAPEEDGIESVDLETGTVKKLISLAELAATAPTDCMRDAMHYLNHIQVSPTGKQIAFFHIWHRGDNGWRVRLYTMGVDGSQLSCLLDTAMISHYDWLDDERILVWAQKPGFGQRFLLCDRRDSSNQVIGDGILVEDGHCSFSPNRRWVLNDTYPDAHGMRTLMLYQWPNGPRIDIARLYSPKTRWWGEIRCDLHPRWNRDGTQVCIDSVHNGERQMYLIDVADIVGRRP